jgi:hypothetical protein
MIPLILAATILIPYTDPACVNGYAITGSPPNQTLGCAGGPPPPQVPVCTVTGPSTAQINTPVMLSAACNPAASSYAWTGGTCPTQHAATCTDTQAAAGTINYTVQGTNAAGTGAASPAHAVTYSGSSGPIVCPGYNSTVVLELTYSQQDSELSSGFGPNDALVAHFRTSSAPASGSTKGQLYAVEYGTGPAARAGAINTTPCNFTTGLVLFKCSGSTSAFNGDTGPSFGLTQGTTTSSCAIDLQPNTDYYFNINNHPTLGGGCTSASCDMKVNIQKPSGT